MPILDVDRARSIVVIKRSMGKGYAGLDNELYSDPKTGMYFADAKAGLSDISAAIKTSGRLSRHRSSACGWRCRPRR